MQDQTAHLIFLVGTISWSARSFALTCGAGLCLWTLSQLRNRALLIPISSLLIAVGLGLVAFSLAPETFDRLAYAMGVQYAPLAYLIVTILALMAVILYLAIRVSVIDERCRKLAQELALMGHRQPANACTEASHADASPER